jgi:hypothetical protein
MIDPLHCLPGLDLKSNTQVPQHDKVITTHTNAKHMGGTKVKASIVDHVHLTSHKGHVMLTWMGFSDFG